MNSCRERGSTLLAKVFNSCAGHRNKSLNSAEWIRRRLKDPYIERSKIENYRCRSAFKLIEIDDRFRIIKAGQTVIDIGAAPGSWSQVLVQRTNALGEDANKPRGKVISVDRSPIYHMEGVTLLCGMDFTHHNTHDRIKEALNGEKLSFVFSDMAPNASGVKSLDADNIYNLNLFVLAFAVANLQTHGGCLMKTWEGRHHELFEKMNKFFTEIKYVKPPSSQKASSEIFLLGRDFKCPTNG